MIGLGVGLDDRVFEPVRFADELAGVDIDRHQRFGLVDDDIAARFQPDLRAQRLFEFGGDVERVEDRRGPRVQLYAADQRRLEALHEAQNALVDVFVIHPDGLERCRQLVAENALHDVQIVMQQRRRGLLLRLLADIQPEVVEKLHVGRDLFFASGLRRRCAR